MKKTLNNIFDEANANELEKLVSQNAASDVSADTLSSVKNKVYAKTGITKTKSKKPFAFRWQSYVAVAACLCLVVGVMFGTGVFRFPSVQPDDDVEPDIEYYALNDLLNRKDFANIIWGTSGDNTSADEDPNQSGGGINTDHREDDTWVEWNGIKISTALRDAFIQLKTDETIAISVRSLGNPEYKLDDYAYNGKSYSEILNAYQLASNSKGNLAALKRFSNLYDEWDNKDDEEFWNKLYDAVDEELVAKYFEGEKKNGRFNTTAISDDLNACETEMLQLENDLSACRREYNAKYNAVPLLSQMMNKGYYVVGNDGVFVVILPVGNLVQFSEDVRALYEDADLQNVVFKIASRSDLGIERNTPTDGVVPGGIVEDIPLPDDVVDEPAVDG